MTEGKMTREEALERLRDIREVCKTSYLPLLVSIGDALTPILAALSSPDCACKGEVLAEVEGGVREDEVDDIYYDIRDLLLSRRIVKNLRGYGEKCRWLRILVLDGEEEARNDRG